MFDLESFAESLLAENKYLASVDDPEILEQMKEDLVDSIDDHINAMILAEMPPNKLIQFEKLVDANNEDKLSAFINANIPNLDMKLTQLLIDFKKTYLGLLPYVAS